MAREGRFSVAAQVRAVDKMTRPLGGMQRVFRRFTTLSGRQVDKLNKKLGEFSIATAQRGAAVATAGIGIALADATRRAVNFEQTLVNAAAKFPGEIRKGTQAFEELKTAARTAGLEVGITAQSSAEGLDFLAMAGFNAEQSLAALPKLFDLQAIAQGDLATTVDIATDSLGAFNLMTKDSVQLSKNLARVNDILAKTITTSNTNIELLFETIKTGGPVAVSAGGSLETYAAFAGVLANAGIKGEEAGTTLKNVFIRLAAQTPKATAALESLGVTTRDQSGNLRDVVDIFADINKGIQREKLGTAETAAVLNDIFGRIPIAGVNILLKAGADNLREYRKQLEGATGASQKMAKQMRDTLKGALDKLVASFESLQLTIFDMNQGAANDLIAKITAIVREIDIFIQTNQELVRGIVADFIMTAIGVIKIIGLIISAFLLWKAAVLAVQGTMIAFHGILLIFKLVLIAIKTVIIALKVAQALWNIAMFQNPIGAIIGLVMLLIAAFVLLIENWDAVADFFGSMWGAIATVFSTGIAIVMSIIDPFIKTVSGIGGLFKKFGIISTTAEEEEKGTASPAGTSVSDRQVITRTLATSRSVRESRESQTAEVVIRPEGVQAEMRKNTEGGAVKIKLASSGGA